MKKHLNNKGYMLVEIILASVIAMGVAYFLTELTIKLKNKNDDLLVKTLVATDQAIIYNKIMNDLYTAPSSHPCTKYGISQDYSTGNKIFTYKGTFKNVISKYATVGEFSCSSDSEPGYIIINLPITVKQLPDEDFSIDIKYKLP